MFMASSLGFRVSRAKVLGLKNDKPRMSPQQRQEALCVPGLLPMLPYPAASNRIPARPKP